MHRHKIVSRNFPWKFISGHSWSLNPTKPIQAGSAFPFVVLSALKIYLNKNCFSLIVVRKGEPNYYSVNISLMHTGLRLLGASFRVGSLCMEYTSKGVRVSSE